MKKLFVGVVIMMLVLGYGDVAFAAGNISATLKYSQFLNNDINNDSIQDFVNWNAANSGGVTVSDTKIEGFIWGDTVGWINLGPFTSAGPTAGVKNTCDGDLSGYAWGQNTGWINFAPTNATGNYEPKINTSTGAITGTVWSQNYGWIQLNSQDGTYAGLNTDWRPSVNCSQSVDLCTNISGTQLTVPVGYIKDPSTPGVPGVCTEEIITTGKDICRNILGDQYAVPSGHYKVPPDPGVVGDCFPIANQTDLCTNINGIQLTVPAGYVKNPSTPGVPGVCTEPINPPYDACPGIPGIQNNTNQCPSDSTSPDDVCPNIPGEQESVPTGLQIDGNGNCVSPLDPPEGDACPGIPGNQSSILECPPAQPNDVCPTLPGIQISISQCPGSDEFEGGNGDGADGARAEIIGFIDDTVDYIGSSKVAWIIPVVGLASSLPGLITRFGNVLLAFFFRRKKMRGIVYDSVTKEPLDPAYVSVIDAVTNLEVITAITDMEGRYGFVLKKGSYKIVASKTHYQFPSQKLQGKTADEVYEQLYFGEVFTVENEEEVVTKNIPMDPIEKDWNQEEKRRMNPIKYFMHTHKVWGVLCDVLFVVGFIFSLVAVYYSPILWNFIIIGIYIVIGALQFFGFGPVALGKITRAGEPVPFAIVRVMNTGLNREVAHKVTSQLGGYYILVPKADYYITIDQKNAEGGYTKIFTSEPMKASQGVINRSFEV